MKKSSEKKIFKAIGCMSGTAMDGIDIALIETDGYAYIKPIAFSSTPFPDDFRTMLKTCLNKSDRTQPEVKLIENDFTRRHIDLIKTIINESNLSYQDIDIIGFHGQTIHHDPQGRITVQLGDGDLLSHGLGIDVVYDFRMDDVKAGGQGAPLLPIYHRALTQAASIASPVAIVNIGGVGNVTWISDDQMIAFDTGPGNALIDDYVMRQTGKPYDENGQLASLGHVNQSIIERFLSLDYFTKPYPKSLDRNDFDKVLTNDLGTLAVNDAIATLAEMTVQSIALGLRQCPNMPQSVYITGGGRHNHYIMTSLETVTGVTVASVDALGWNGDAMEAEGFAYMAVRRLLNEPISFPTTTGCPHPMMGGVHIKSRQKAHVA